jgi:hypothetical protein
MPALAQECLVCQSRFTENGLMLKLYRHRSFLVLFLLSACPGFGQELTNTFLKGPYLQGPGPDTITIKWEAPAEVPGLVRYGLKGKVDHEFSAGKPRPLVINPTNTVYLYEVTLPHLKPDSTYSYQAECSGKQTPIKHFKTFARHQRKVTFIAYGDNRTNPNIHAAVTANFKRYSPDFILHTGDLVANGTRYDLWGKEFFGPTANVLDEIPLLPSIGNHEADGDKYVSYMRLPGKERHYSYDLGPVHVLALDFHFDKETDSQFAFAKEDLMKSKAPWKIVYLHYPVFNIGGHATGWAHSTYLPLFHKAKVDLVVTGHSHVYERFFPIAGEGESDSWPITHITTGGGGAPLASSYPHPALANWACTNHFVLFEATSTTMKIRAITTNNVVIDSFSWKKRKGQPEEDYLAKVYPEEALKLFWEAGPSMTAGLTSVPSRNTAALAMFTIRPLKKPAQIQIELMPESAPFYQLEDSPLVVTAPSSTESNKIVWAKVRSLDSSQSRIDGRSVDLVSPAMKFQGRIQIGSVDTLAYGQRCRVTEAAAEAAKARADANSNK